MNIERASLEDIQLLKPWFATKQASYLWGGPGLRFPYTEKSFLEDIFWGKMPSYSCKDQHKNLIGFGQYYEKAKRCHLARLAINPSHRSRGLGREFIGKLMSIAMSNLGLDECSLFVVTANEKAVACYKSLGFRFHAYPQWQTYFEGIEFMVFSGNNLETTV